MAMETTQQTDEWMDREGLAGMKIEKPQSHDDGDATVV